MRATNVNRGPVVPALLCIAVSLSACGGGSGSGGGNGGGAGAGGGSDPGPPGSVQFNASSLSVNENDGTATLTIARTGGTAGAVSVALISSDGSATAGSDYTAVSTSVTFPAGDATARTVTVPIADDDDAEADETLSLILSAPTGGASIGANGATTLTILDDDPPAAPVLSGLGSELKRLGFQWEDVPRATHYRVLRSPDGVSEFVQVSDDVAPGINETSFGIAVHRLDWANALYRLDACNAHGCSASAAITARDAMLPAIGYFKASNAQAGDIFGNAIALSADGLTLAVAARGEDSASGNDQSNNGATDSGAVYVFTFNGTQWLQQAYLKASNAQEHDLFGVALALSADGRTLAVGANGEDSAATGVGGDETDNNAQSSGAVYVFTREGTQWSQQAYVKASNTESFDAFGSALALSGDGHTLAVGAPNEDSDATGAGGDEADNDARSSGAVYVFARQGTQWSQRAYVKASNTEPMDAFGSALALSGNGHALAVGAPGEDSDATGSGGDQSNNNAQSSGAVYVYAWDTMQWSQQAYLKASNTDEFDEFGVALSLSADGHTLAVGAPSERGRATGVGGDETDNGAAGAGAAYVFARDAAQWSQQAYVKASNTEPGATFALALALSADGQTLAVGSVEENSDALGVNGDQNSGNAIAAGAVYTYTRAATTWLPQAYVKASNTGARDAFGGAVGLSADGGTLVVAAPSEASNQAGMGADQTNNDAFGAGAAYLY